MKTGVWWRESISSPIGGTGIRAELDRLHGQCGDQCRAQSHNPGIMTGVQNKSHTPK